MTSRKDECECERMRLLAYTGKESKTGLKEETGHSGTESTVREEAL